MKEVINDIICRVVLDTRYSRDIGNDTKYKVAIRLTFGGERKYIHLSAFCTKKEWKYFFTTRVPYRKQQTQNVLTDFHKVLALVRQLVAEKKFSFANLDYYMKIKKNKSAAYIYIDEKIDEIIQLKNDGEHYSTADTYKELSSSLISFTGKRVKILDINVEFLNRYVKYLKEERGNSIATVGIRLRNLRHVYNDLVKRDIIPKGLNPFIDFKIATAKGRKLAINDEVLDQVKAAAGESEFVRLWLASYYMQGINFCDMLRLKGQNVSLAENVIHFVRKKTRDATAVVTEIDIPINDRIVSIMKTFTDLSTAKEDEYLFPYLNNYETEIQRDDRVKYIIKRTNKVFAKLFPDIKITTYTARHTFATKLLRMGASTETISQCLGHTSVLVTRAYLAGLENHAITKYTNLL